MPIERKLAAIMFTDIAGYTALSAKDSTKSSELLKTQRDTLKPIVEKHGGSWMKEIGDGLLLTFDSATSAVECSIAIQEATKDMEDLNLRIGIHEGEVIKQDGDVIGDDVNVASRIEPFSAVGGVAISDKIYRAISSNTEFETKYIGQPKLKGVSQEVKVYCITSHGLPETDVSKVSAKLEQESKFNIYALTGGILTAIGIAFWIVVGVFDVSFGGKVEVPSVGILMMENIGGEDEEFWARGITEDLIIKLAGAGLIRVAPMKEILEVDIKESFEAIAKQLRVKYILTSSIHKKEKGFDLRSQLIEAESGVSTYAKKWSEPLDNSPKIVGTLADDILKTLEVSSKQDIAKAPTTNAEAYEYYLKGKFKYDNDNLRVKEYLEITQELLLKAIELDDNLLAAKILLGQTYGYKSNVDKNTLIDKQREIYKKVLEQAEKIGDKFWMGRSLRYIGNTFFSNHETLDEALDYYKRSLEINIDVEDNLGMAASINNIGAVYLHKGSIDKALYYFKRSLKIYEKIDDKREMGGSLQNIGMIYHDKADYDKTLDYYARALKIFEEFDDQESMGWCINDIGNVYYDIVDHEKALDYYIRSFKIFEVLSNKEGRGQNLHDIGMIYHDKVEYEKALEHYLRLLKIYEELDDKVGIGQSLNLIAAVYGDSGDYYKTLDYCIRSLKINEDNGNKFGMARSLANIGFVYYNIGEYNKTLESLEKAHTIAKELGAGASGLIWITPYLYLAYKQLNKTYDEKQIHTLIKEAQKIEYEINYRLYQLLEDNSYLETAYNQVKEKANNLEPDIAAKFLSYPIPAAIVEEWEKVK